MPFSNKVIADWKFSKSDDSLRVLQLAGYSYLYYCKTGEKINMGLIVRVHPETGKVYQTYYKSLWKWTKVFLTLRKVYDLIRGKGVSTRTLKAK